VLNNEDLTETVRSFLDDEIDALVGQHLAGEDPDAWNLDALSAALTAMGLGGDKTSADALWDVGGREAITEYLRDHADERLEAREAEIGEADWAQVERIVLLRTIDSLWVEHLTELDDMRRGIGLRGYAQQDPLNEFRREAFVLYEELRGLIRQGVASSIFRVTVQRNPPSGGDAAVGQALARGAAALTGQAAAGSGNGAAGRRTPAAVSAGSAATIVGAAAPGSAVVRGSLPTAPAARNIRTSLGDQPLDDGTANGAGGAPAGGGARPGYTPTGERIGRNDPCWCGSGAKYKKCHGR
jgi:preprotein translocase subunit SecA